METRNANIVNEMIQGRLKLRPSQIGKYEVTESNVPSIPRGAFITQEAMSKFMKSGISCFINEVADGAPGKTILFG